MEYLQLLANKYTIDSTECNLSILGLQGLLFFEPDSELPYHKAKRRLLNATKVEQIKNQSSSYFTIPDKKSCESRKENAPDEDERDDSMFGFTCEVFQAASKKEKEQIWKQTQRMHKYVARIYRHRHLHVNKKTHSLSKK